MWTVPRFQVTATLCFKSTRNGRRYSEEHLRLEEREEYEIKTPWPESASELSRPSDRRLSAKLVPTFAVRGCRMVSATDPYGRILGFLDRSSRPSSSSVVLTRLSGPRSRPTTSQKIW
jgi:hypothetical protein